MSEVANTILKQIGGRRFRVMTGASNFLAGDRDLSFRLPGGGGFCKNGINWVVIRLAPSDTYTVEFYRTRARTFKKIEQRDGVYFDQLEEVFRSVTGLETRMPKVVMA